VKFDSVDDRNFFKVGKVKNKPFEGPAFEFRRSPLTVDPPLARDVINEIFGIPVPIRGADILLFGGLRTSEDGSLVVNISGAAGTGKTSFAIALAATLSPFGTRCYYITTEEAGGDLMARLLSLIPSYLRGLSIYNREINDWFYVADLRNKRSIEFPEANDAVPSDDSTVAGDVAKRLTERLKTVCAIIEDKKNSNDNNSLVLKIAPFMVVIDSVFALSDGRDLSELKALSEFVDWCRELKVLVIILSTDELPKHSRLAYMVDVIFRLTYRDTESENKKPERILQLTKTRFQISRPGAHVFHMSGREGFRISPQLSSQLDKEEQRNKTEPDQKQIIAALNCWDSKITDKIDAKYYQVVPLKNGKYLDLFCYSRILIHGHGSSGKAGLGLKLLLFNVSGKDKHYDNRRVLVISFLYSETYYEKVAKKIDQSSQITSLTFSPGFLPPEDFMNKVSRKIEEAELCGKPFTGVLLDGLHTEKSAG